ncbi:MULTISPECIES: hypothetical protein [unclassified Polaribacter]|uniref:hypothetical protein n=1 Tax=unclassified Polaribacter TaxID=196858 RepID=UPI0011BEAC11|nr:MULTISPECIES: hypothetical protein [unclassified Polaribacter]TXD51163.1 hypothetical protein ES043_13285 [Polaribacter sp. IC063]TXD56541.1 hypothetical protein ES044_16610 [Polaribacter sp. IC066]
MNSGIIIVFNNDEQTINVNEIVEILDENNFKICLVNNSNSKNISKALDKIKFQSSTNSDVFILDNKHDKGLKYAVKAGARFLLNETEFDFIIYLKSDIIGYFKEIKECFNQLDVQKESFTPCPTRSERNVLRDVFPFEEFLKLDSSF